MAAPATHYYGLVPQTHYYGLTHQPVTPAIGLIAIGLLAAFALIMAVIARRARLTDGARRGDR